MRSAWDRAPQSCHLTDHSYPDHLAAGASPTAITRECAGSVMLVLREMGQLARPGGDPDRYLEERPDGLTGQGLIHWTGRMGARPKPYGPAPLPGIEDGLIRDESRYGRP